MSCDAVSANLWAIFSLALTSALYMVKYVTVKCGSFMEIFAHTGSFSFSTTTVWLLDGDQIINVITTRQVQFSCESGDDNCVFALKSTCCHHWHTCEKDLCKIMLGDVLVFPTHQRQMPRLFKIANVNFSQATDMPTPIIVAKLQSDHPCHTVESHFC